MSDKQKQPLQQEAPKDQQALADKACKGGDAGERDRGAGMDGAERHGQSGHRVSDQGKHKR